MMHSLAAVQAMLIGFAIECLLKGIWIKKHRAWTDEGQDHALTKDGRLERIAGVGDHELKQLAVAADVTISTQEQRMLQRLSGFVKFASRYPIPTTWQQMRPTATATGEPASPNFFSPAEFKLAENLAKRLTQEALPWNDPSS